MPTPGGHSYDLRRPGRGGKVNNQGIPDEHPDQTANEILQQDNAPASSRRTGKVPESLQQRCLGRTAGLSGPFRPP